MIATPFTDFGLFSLDEEDTSGLEPTFWDDTSELDPNALLFDDIDLSISNDEPSLQLAIAADDLSVCSSLSSPPPVKRARRADVCDYPDVAPGEETQTRPETTTQEQLQKYWCPTNFAFSFGNLPACDRRPAKKSPSELGLFPPTPPSDEPGSELNDRPPFSDPTGFTNLQWCSLRKSIFSKQLEMENQSAATISSPHARSLSIEIFFFFMWS